MSSAHLTTKSPMSPSPLVHLRIAYRRLVLCWLESEWLQPLVIGLLIWAVVLAPIVYVLVEVW
jgi:hypothetical protein